MFLKRSYLYLTIILMSLSVASCGSAEGDLIDEMIDAYGGEANLKKLNSFKTEWQMINMMRGDEGSVVVYAQFPDKFRTEVSGGMSGFETRVVNGERAGKAVMNRPISEQSGPMMTATKFGLKRIYTPLMLREIQPMLSLAEYKEGDKHKVLVYDQGQGMFAIKYFVNAKTKLVDKVTGTLKMQRREMEFIAEYGDYKEVGGVMIAHTENKFAAGMNTAFLNLQNITLSAKFEPSLFSITGQGRAATVPSTGETVKTTEPDTAVNEGAEEK